MPEEPEIGKKLCFVIGPIDEPGSDVRRHADWLLEGILAPVFIEHFTDFKLERADKIGAPGMITSQIITRLLDAPLVVADMTFHNANAFYELAIRHMVGLPTIHMIAKESKIPFDVAPHRAIVFARDDYRDILQAREALRAAVDEAVKDGFVVENPITHARGRAALNERATPEMKVLMETVDFLQSRVSELTTRTKEQGAALAPILNFFAPSLGASLGKGGIAGTFLPESLHVSVPPVGVFVEAAPKGEEGDPIDNWIVTDHSNRVLHKAKTREDAISWAKLNGLIAHVARSPHLNDKSKPDHWRAV